MAISFVFRKQSSVVETPERYDFPVLTQKAYAGEKCSVARFEMNKALLLALGITLGSESMISIGQNDSGDLVLVNTTGLETPYQHHVNRDGSINSKKLLERLEKSGFQFDKETDNEFSLLGGSEDGLSIATIASIVNIIEDHEDIPTLMENALTEAEVMEADDDFDAMEAMFAEAHEVDMQKIALDQNDSELSDIQRDFI